MRPLAALFLLMQASCSQSSLTFEAAQPAPFRTPPQRMLVVLNGAVLPYGDNEAHGGALLRELASCNLQTALVVRPADADLSLNGDVLARTVAERSRAFRPDAILTISPTNRTSSDYALLTQSYSIEVRDAAEGRAALRAVARFSPEGRRDTAMSAFARLLTNQLAKAGVFPCPGRPA